MILNGKKIAAEIYDELKLAIKKLSIPPKLGAILVWNDEVSLRYIAQKKRFAEMIGMDFELFQYPQDISQKQLLENIETLNNDIYISGYIVQLPLPKFMNTQEILKAIHPRKDVDGFHPENQGKVMIGDPTGFTPCTPAGIMKIFEYYKISIPWKKITLLGRSNIVWKPLSNLLINAGATLISCNSLTPDIGLYTKDADIVISAVWKPGIIHADIVRKDSIIIDVGFSIVNGEICGDSMYDELISQGNTITPVPWWVGPMTVAMLLTNTYQAQWNIQKL